MHRWNLPCDPLLALQQGDSAPFEAFVRLHARTLIAFFRQRGASPGRAEDLSQEVFLKLHQGAPRYRPEERFAAYCMRVARNAWIDECRRGGVRPDLTQGTSAEELEGQAAPEVDPSAGLVVEEEEIRLRRILESLPSSHREVFELAVLGELAYAEIASVLGIPVGTVKSRMFYAVRRLRLVWESEAGDGPCAGEEGVA